MNIQIGDLVKLEPGYFISNTNVIVARNRADYILRNKIGMVVAIDGNLYKISFPPKFNRDAPFIVSLGWWKLSLVKKAIL